MPMIEAVLSHVTFVTVATVTKVLSVRLSFGAAAFWGLHAANTSNTPPNRRGAEFTNRFIQNSISFASAIQEQSHHAFGAVPVQRPLRINQMSASLMAEGAENAVREFL